MSCPATTQSARMPPPGPETGLSLVICTRDRPQILSRCLDSVRAQTEPADEIIVVDNASRDPLTRCLCAAAGVRYVREDRPGLDIARNTGIGAARGALIAMTDDDTIAQPDWLAQIRVAFEDARTDAVTGNVLPLKRDSFAANLFETEWALGRGDCPKLFAHEDFQAARKTGFEAWKIGAGANMAFRAATFRRYGLFDPALDVGAAGCSGDSELWYRILGQGGRCLYHPAAVVRHEHRDTEDALKRQLKAYMRGHVAALRVQAQRFPDHGNYARIMVALPVWFGARVWRRLRHGRCPKTWFVFAELLGYAEGLVYPIGPRRRALI